MNGIGASPLFTPSGRAGGLAYVSQQDVCRRLQEAEAEATKLRLQLNNMHAACSVRRDEMGQGAHAREQREAPSGNPDSAPANDKGSRCTHGGNTRGGLRAAVRGEIHMDADLHEEQNDFDLKLQNGAALCELLACASLAGDLHAAQFCSMQAVIN